MRSLRPGTAAASSLNRRTSVSRARRIAPGPAPADQFHGAVIGRTEARKFLRCRLFHHFYLTLNKLLDKDNSCSYSSLLEVSRARKRSETEEKEMTTEAPAKTITWTADPMHSIAEFAVKHFVVTTVKGRFRDLEATLHIDEANPENSWAEAKIAVASVDTNVEVRDNDLRSDNFFSADKFPYITFRSTRVERAGRRALQAHGRPHDPRRDEGSRPRRRVRGTDRRPVRQQAGRVHGDDADQPEGLRYALEPGHRERRSRGRRIRSRSRCTSRRSARRRNKRNDSHEIVSPLQRRHVREELLGEVEMVCIQCGHRTYPEPEPVRLTTRQRTEKKAA